MGGSPAKRLDHRWRPGSPGPVCRCLGGEYLEPGSHGSGGRNAGAAAAGGGRAGGQYRHAGPDLQLHALYQPEAGTMSTWVLIAGDFTPLGGMDYANHALARYLGGRAGNEVHLVTHRAWEELAALPAVIVHRVWRTMNYHLAGMPLLARTGRRWARRLRAREARVVVNGGNCSWYDVTWVHYVHAAYCPQTLAPSVYRLKNWASRRYVLAAERRTLARARVVLCNSRRTYRDVVERLGVAWHGCGPLCPRDSGRARRSANRHGLAARSTAGHVCGSAGRSPQRIRYPLCRMEDTL
ncbi:MAG: hypothetical protein E6K70_02715 [Planctomycetota bacterium]|nr:MAG: hypothetical protein E6K70_02715 [Planctomycetota bacterium]